MPLYEYQCDACGHRFEMIRKFSDPPVEVCPQCGGAVRKLVSASAFQLKGSGWYISDYARKESAKADGGSKDASEAKADGSKDEKADSKDKAEKTDKSEKSEKAGTSDKSASGGDSASKPATPSGPTGST